METVSVLAAILPFPVIGRCRNHLVTLLSSSAWSKMPDLPLEFRRYLSSFHRYKYFRFRWPYRYWLSAAVSITCRHFLRTLYGRKPRICRWNFNSVSRGFSDISGLRSILERSKNTFVEVALVGNPRFAVRMLTTSVILSEI